MFRRLSTQLTVIYAGLFGLVLALIAGAVFITVESNAHTAVRAAMTSSSATFDRLWKAREEQLASTASVLARDFGFRQAVATGDSQTMLSALDNLQDRLEHATAFIVDLDGHVTSLAHTSADADRSLLDALNADGEARGVLVLGGAPYQAVAEPVNAPTLIGWVVFGERLTSAGVSELEKLSAAGLDAHLYIRPVGGAWEAEDATDALAHDGKDLSAKVFNAANQGSVSIPENDSIAGVKMLEPFGGERASAAMILEYSMKAEQSAYRSMLLSIMGIGAIGAIALVVGSWFVSRGVTGPISALRTAAERLARGDLAEVVIGGRNEIAQLAVNFNTMSAEIAAREKRITLMAQNDIETGLPNLRALEGRLGKMRERHARGEIFGVAIGIDRFQHLRGAIGHALSARLVAEIAAGVSARFGELSVGRITSDTIGAVFRADSMEAALSTAAAIAETASQPVRLGADRIDVLASVGLACDGLADDMALSLLERAEAAVAQARERRARSAAFDRKAYGDPAAALSLMSNMIAGLGRGELYLAHQPKLDLRAGAMCSAESLLRWKHPERGMIPPDTFIGMAEETGHIRPLSDWVLDRAIADQRRMRAEGLDITLSINISGRLIASEDFAERALRQIRRADAKLCFEITETAVIDNHTLALDIMRELSAAGVELSIDDYGSGLSSLSYLRSIPAQELKIDRMFVQELGRTDHGSSDALLVKSTIDLAHSLGMKVTAEGVETAEALALLQAMGADTAQGYYFARPMPLDALLDFWRAAPAALNQKASA